MLDVVTSRWFSDSHFAKKLLVDFETDIMDNLSVSTDGETIEAGDMSGIYADSSDVTVCERLVFDGPLGKAITDQVPTMLPSDEDRTMLFPKNTCASELLACALSYSDEWDSYQEDAFNQDCDILDGVIQAAWSKDPSDLLKAIMETSNVQYRVGQGMEGKTFAVSFTSAGDMKVELVQDKSPTTMTIKTGDNGLHVVDRV